jgi:hypothetical protein
MNIYPVIKNHNLPIFNSDDYPDTLEETEKNNTDVNLDDYIKKSGDTMNGQLNCNQGIRFSDGTLQHSGFTTQHNTAIDSIVGIDFDMFESSTVTTNDLFITDSIVFTHDGIQSKALTDELILDISLNTLKLTPITTNHSEIKIDRNLFFDHENQTLARLGILNSGNDFEINTVGNMAINSGSDNILLWSNTLNIGKGSNCKINMNGETQTHCFTNEQYTLLSTLETDVSNNTHLLDGVFNDSTDIVFTKTLNLKDSDTTNIVNTLSNYNTFDKNISLLRSNNVYRKWWIGTAGDNINPQNDFSICVNGNYESPECVLNLTPQGELNIKTLSLNGVEQESFITSLKDDIVNNTAKIDNNFIFNELDTEFIKDVKLKNTILFDDGVPLGRIGYWEGDGGLYIQSNNKIVITSLSNDILLWSELVKIGKGNTSNVIRIHGSSSSITMNGATQNYCYTNADRDLLYSLENPAQKMLLKIKPANMWSIYGRTAQFVSGTTYPSSGNLNYHLFPLNLEPEFTPYINPYTYEWNQGTTRIRIKYNMSFKSNSSLVINFFSQIKIYNSANQLVNIDPPRSGIESDQGLNYRDWIHYNDDLIIDIENGQKIFLYTEFDMSMNYNRTFETSTVFEITEL